MITNHHPFKGGALPVFVLLLVSGSLALAFVDEDSSETLKPEVISKSISVFNNSDSSNAFHAKLLGSEQYSEALLSDQISYVSMTGATAPPGQLNTATLLQYGGISVAIILSLCCLISILTSSIADLIRVLLPVMLKQSDTTGDK